MPDVALPELLIDRSVGRQAVPQHFRDVWPSTVRTLDEVFGYGKVEDQEWMQRADAEGWVAVCKDDRIRRRPGERELMSGGSLRVFCLTNGQLTRDRMVDYFAKAGPRLIEHAAEAGPWMLGVYAGGKVARLTLYT